MGAGELSIALSPAAIRNAFDATGARLRQIPLYTPERVLEVLKARNLNQLSVA